jgi:hypothetical protein
MPVFPAKMRGLLGRWRCPRRQCWRRGIQKMVALAACAEWHRVWRRLPLVASSASAGRLPLVACSASAGRLPLVACSASAGGIFLDRLKSIVVVGGLSGGILGAHDADCHNSPNHQEKGDRTDDHTSNHAGRQRPATATAATASAA